jgi:hypothetical protein
MLSNEITPVSRSTTCVFGRAKATGAPPPTEICITTGWFGLNETPFAMYFPLPTEVKTSLVR